MTNQIIFLEAVKKAYKNKPNDFVCAISDHVLAYNIHHDEHYAVIFSHEFAKAFWGDYVIDLTHTCEIPIYKYHLQLMILEDNPLKYLEKFLKD